MPGTDWASLLTGSGAVLAPLTTLTIFGVRWRNKRVLEHDLRTNLAVEAAQKAANAARSEERERTEQLLQERQKTIDRYEVMLRTSERAQEGLRAQLQAMVQQLANASRQAGERDSERKRS